MKSPAIPARSLTAAIGIALLSVAGMASSSASLAHGGTELSVRDTATMDGPLVMFGSANDSSHAARFTKGVPARRVLRADALQDKDMSRLQAPATLAMAVVAASELDRLGDARARLSQLFDAGVPVFVCMDSGDRSAVTRFFGMAPSGSDVIFVREKNGDIDILGGADDESHWTPQWSPASSAALSRFQSSALVAIASNPSRAGGAGSASVPILRMHEGVFETGTDEITGKLDIDVIRSADRSGDDKEVHVYVRPTYAPSKAGIDDNKDNKGFWAAYMPIEYNVSHEVTTDGPRAAMVAHMPASDSRTEFNYQERTERKFTIGGTSGDSLSADGLPDALLAAKMPFNLSVGYEHSTSEEMSFQFKDYSLAASEVDGGQRMLWLAQLDSKLTHKLVEKEYADRVKLTEKYMTPMMRRAGMETFSAWKLPGEYEGIATVRINVRYALDVKKWWWHGPDWNRDHSTQSKSVGRIYELDLSHPYLTREITVLLRSEEGLGACVTQRRGVVELSACDPSDRAQMWGLDSEGRYVNRGNGQCLQADFGEKVLMTAKCSLANNQRWEWRADRIHSRYDGTLHRLYVQNGQLRFFVGEGKYENLPTNPHSPALRPWAGYPAKPLTGELVPAPYGTVPGHVPAEWSTMYGPTGVEQRWSPVVLRAGL
ncbi:MAG: Hemolysin [Luteibacter sp.]|nr:MAG: Hemolysin [Luteibacter sp.]